MLKKFLESNFPELKGHVYGANFPPPAHAVYFVQLTQVVQLTAVVLMFFGDRLFSMFGYTSSPQILQMLHDNQLQVFIALFLLSSIAQGMVATGAFEIELNGEVIHSKLATGRLPSVRGITDALTRKGLKALSGQTGMRKF